jgi:uncharacterized protein (DUF2141 family)
MSLLSLVPPILQLICTNIAEAKGSIYVAVFDRQEDFLNTDKMRAQRIVPVSQTGQVNISFTDLPPGTYAISCFHDVNGNGQIDKNWMGIPTEPYGFSNNARPKFRAPNWGETKFELKAAGGAITIRLEKW